MDTMLGVKLVFAFCGSLLIYLLGGWLSETVYHVGDAHGGHGDDHHQAYYIDTGEDDHGEEEAEEVVPLADLMAAADIGSGEKVLSLIHI